MAAQSDSCPEGAEPEEEESSTGAKATVRRYLENHYVEIGVLVLVLLDIAFVAMEAGIDFGVVCIRGKEVPHGSPAGAHLVHQHGGEPGHGHRPSHSLLLGEGSLLSPESAVLGLAAHMFSRHSPGPALMQWIAGDRAAPTLLRSQAMSAPSHVTAVRAGSDSFLGSTERTSASAASAEVQPDHTKHELTNDDGHDAEVHEHEQAGSGGHQHEGSHDHDAGHSDPPDVLVCEGHHGHTVHYIVHTCHFWSIVILCIFAVELILKTWSIPNFLADPWHKLDCAVVFLSLVTDTLVVYLIENMKSTEREKEEREGTMYTLIALVLLSRCWRIVRIVHGLYEFEEKRMEVAHEFSHRESPHHAERSMQA